MTSLLPAPVRIATDGVELACYRAGKGPAAVLLHGFPATSVSLHRQFDHLVRAGYDCIAIDQRGFGASDCPADPAAYRLEVLARDIVDVLDALGIAQACLVGHDWGGAVAWAVALRHAERVSAVVSLGTILFPRSVTDPIPARRAAMGDDNYVVAFQEAGRADAILNADIGRSVDFMFRKNFMTMAAIESAPPLIRNFELLNELQRGSWPGEPALSPEERAAMVAAFERTTFTPGLNWYRNITRNWIESADVTEKIDVPCLIVSGNDDYFAPPAFAEMSRTIVSNLDLATVPGGHWFPLEAPHETNNTILGWIAAHHKDMHA